MGRGGYGVLDLRDKHLPQSPFTGQFLDDTIFTFCIAFYESYLSTVTIQNCVLKYLGKNSSNSSPSMTGTNGLNSAIELPTRGILFRPVRRKNSAAEEKTLAPLAIFSF
jgi:hypothetical protein